MAAMSNDSVGARPGQRLLERLRERDGGPLRRWRDRPDPTPPTPAPDAYVPSPSPVAPPLPAPPPLPPAPPPAPPAARPGFAAPAGVSPAGWSQAPAAPGSWSGAAPTQPGAAPGVDPARHGLAGVPIPAMPGPLGVDWHRVAAKAFGFLIKAWATILDMLGLRQATPAQAEAARQQTEAVLAIHDLGRTGYVYGPALDAWVGRDQVATALARDDRNRDGMLDRGEIQRAFERQAIAATPLIQGEVELPAWLRGGLGLKGSLSTGPALAPGQAPSIRATVNVGPEVLREVEAQAYTIACQAIATRQLPELEVPAIAKQALARWGAGNADGQANGAIAINLNEPALVEAVRAGLTRAVVDTPLRRHTLRPEGMARMRAALINSGLAQQVVVKQVDAQVGQVQRQLETLSNGVVVFQDLPVGATGVRVTYIGDGYLADLAVTPHDLQRLLMP